MMAREYIQDFIRRRLAAGVPAWIVHIEAQNEYPLNCAAWSYVLQIKRRMEQEKSHEQDN